MEGAIWVEGYTTRDGRVVEGYWRQPGRHGLGTGASDTAHDPGPLITTANGGVDVRTSRPGHSAATAAPRDPRVAAGLEALRRRREATARGALHQQPVTEPPTAAATEPPVAHVSDPEDGTADPTKCPHCGQFADDAHRCPTPAGLPEGDYAGMPKDERVKAMLGDLEDAVAAVVESGQLQLWLDSMASNGMNRWSANNRLLAMVQMWQRGKTMDELGQLHMMGFRQWEKHNRKVSKGAKAVWILAPITRTITDEDDDGNETTRKRVVGFKGVPVFDVSDTSGEPLATAPVASAPGEATPGTVEGLRNRVAAAGYEYEETEIPDCVPERGEGTLGYTHPATKKVVVDSRLTSAQKASTIAHELGHIHCGHVDGDYDDYRRHRGRYETEAETVAYLVNRSRGMSSSQVNAFSPGYIAGWSKGDRKVMHAAIDKATKAYNKIIDGDWP